MEKQAVKFAGVSFAYEKEHTILSNITLEARKGQIIAIMGGSGSGKTTILKLLSGQIIPDKGQVTSLGVSIDHSISKKALFELRKQLGMLFQFGALFTDMSIYENIAFPLKELTQLPETIIKKIVAMKLKAVGLFGTQELMPQELSGGMARRVALARAMALDPTLMLYDEPFTGLDPVSLNMTALLIKQLSTTLGQTVILVSHDVKASLQIADYLYFVAQGEVIAAGTAQEIINSQDHLVKQFINGEIDGSFRYEYATPIDYINFLGI